MKNWHLSFQKWSFIFNSFFTILCRKKENVVFVLKSVVFASNPCPSSNGSENVKLYRCHWWDFCSTFFPSLSLRILEPRRRHICLLILGKVTTSLSLPSLVNPTISFSLFLLLSSLSLFSYYILPLYVFNSLSLFLLCPLFLFLHVSFSIFLTFSLLCNASLPHFLFLLFLLSMWISPFNNNPDFHLSKTNTNPGPKLYNETCKNKEKTFLLNKSTSTEKICPLMALFYTLIWIKSRCEKYFAFYKNVLMF